MNTLCCLFLTLAVVTLTAEGCSHPQTKDYCDLATKFCKDDCRNECIKECKVKCQKQFGTQCNDYDDFEACDQKETCVMKCPSSCGSVSCDICAVIMQDCVECNENPFFDHLKQYHGI